MPSRPVPSALAAKPRFPCCRMDTHVSTTKQTQLIPPPIAIAIDGVEIAVEARTLDDRPVTRLVRFLPMPQTLAGAAP